MSIPDNLFYTKEHEWIKFIDNIAKIGITEYAQNELGDIIFIELPKKDDEFQIGDVIATIEAVKTVADIFAPINGKVSNINIDLDEKPELINKDPYNNGWIFEMSELPKNRNALLTPAEYKKIIS